MGSTRWRPMCHIVDVAGSIHISWPKWVKWQGSVCVEACWFELHFARILVHLNWNNCSRIECKAPVQVGSYAKISYMDFHNRLNGWEQFSIRCRPPYAIILCYTYLLVFRSHRWWRASSTESEFKTERHMNGRQRQQRRQQNENENEWEEDESNCRAQSNTCFWIIDHEEALFRELR